MIKRDKQRQFLIFVTLTASFLVGCAEDEQEAMPASAQECEVPQEFIARDGSARQRRPTEEELAALRNEATYECLSDYSLALEKLDRILLLVEKAGHHVTRGRICSANGDGDWGGDGDGDGETPGDVDLPMTNCASLKDPNRIECVVKQAEDPELYDYLVESFFPTDVTP